MSKMVIWDQVSKPPASALKTIGAGRLKGMSDINPQWRYQAMTDVFGPCGIGWRYDIKRLWTEPGTDGQMLAFSEIALFFLTESGWSFAVPGIGGSMLVAKEKSGLHSSDEAYKMATTDALSVAMKMLGVGADVYMGRWDGSKYKQDESQVDENIKRAVSEWKQNIDQIAETATLKELREWWPETKAEILHDCGQPGAAEVYQYFVSVGKHMADTAATVAA
jgi:hypothetical protein